MRDLGNTCRGERKARRPANLVGFPPARNVPLVERLVADFLDTPSGPGRAEAFRRKAFASLARRRRALGLSPEAVAIEIQELESAMAARLWQIYPQRGTRA